MSAPWESTIQQLVEEARFAPIELGDLIRQVIEEWQFREGVMQRLEGESR